jgi:hypothetical protein
MHEGQLSGLIQASRQGCVCHGKNRGLGELAKLFAVYKGFQNILLDVQIPIDDAVQPLSQLGKTVYRLALP